LSKRFSYLVVVAVAALAVVAGIFSSTDSASAHSSHNTHSHASVQAANAINTNGIGYAIFQALNRHRAAAGLRPLWWSNALTYGAHRHNLAMASVDTLEHIVPGEAGFATRINQDGIRWWWAGENIGVTTDRSLGGALNLDSMMINERAPGEIGHRLNILSPYADAVGVDVLIANGQLWLTEDLARI